MSRYEDLQQQYEALLETNKKETGYLAPHCDGLVLHAPGKCVYCDKCKSLHAFRRINGINHTGENNPCKYPCFAENRRPEHNINKWGGNRATTETDVLVSDITSIAFSKALTIERELKDETDTPS